MKAKQIIGIVLLLALIFSLGYRVQAQGALLGDQLLITLFFSIVGLVIIWAISRILNQ